MQAILPFAEWRPDLTGTVGAALVAADNVLPGDNGYRPVQAFVALPGTALPSRPLGAVACRSAKRVSYIFAGTATGIYRYSTMGWTAVGSGYSASDDNAWVFQQFGQWVIASNGSDRPQYFDMAGTATAFAALPGTGGVNPPRMGLMAIVRDFIVAAIINGDASIVQWSGINNASEWRAGYGQSDYNPAAHGGSITAIAGGEYGLVLQEERISRMTYVAGNVIFQFDEISPNIGCIHPRSFVQVGRVCYFLSQRGFMACDGNQVTPIGDEKVDRTFLAALDRSYMGRMSCVADPVRKVVYWSVPAYEPNVWFAYSWVSGKWSRVFAAARFMLPGRSRDISLDETYGSPDATFDVGLAFDDPAYLGGDPVFYLFDDTNTLGALTGANMAAAIELGPQEVGGMGRIARARRWRVDTDAVTGLTLKVTAKQRIGDAGTLMTATGPGTSGDIVGRCHGRTLAPRVEIAAGTAWTYAQGVECDHARGGAR